MRTKIQFYFWAALLGLPNGFLAGYGVWLLSQSKMASWLAGALVAYGLYRGLDKFANHLFQLGQTSVMEDLTNKLGVVALMVEEAEKDCDDPQCPVHGRGGLLERFGIRVERSKGRPPRTPPKHTLN